MFFDHSCEQCEATIEMLRDRTLPEGLALIAIDMAEEHQDRDTSGLSFPDFWTVGTADAPVDELYELRATPSFYVIGPDGTVLLKDPPLADVIYLLSP